MLTPDDLAGILEWSCGSHPPETCLTMRRFVRNSCCWLLAALTVLLSLGNSTGLVLCIENDGCMAIESPAEQAACRQRHEFAAVVAAPRGEDRPAAMQAATATGCVDIPLTIAAAPVNARRAANRIAPVERSANPAICAVSPAVASPRSSHVSQARLRSLSPRLDVGGACDRRAARLSNFLPHACGWAACRPLDSAGGCGRWVLPRLFAGQL